jgi:hypothetical protein
MRVGKGTLEILLFCIWLLAGTWIFGLVSHLSGFILIPLKLAWLAILRFGIARYERRYMRPTSPNDLTMGQRPWLAMPGRALVVVSIGLVWTLFVIKARTVWPDKSPFNLVIWAISGVSLFFIVNHLELRWSKR